MADLKADLMDKMERAYQMEEEMAGVLIDLCALDSGVEGVRPQIVKRLQRTLEVIKKDTLRHKKILEGIRETLGHG